MTALSLVISLSITYFILPTVLSYIDRDEGVEEQKEELEKTA